MKRILGLDLGTTSIGWGIVEESEDIEASKIIKLGVRVNPLTTDEKINFEGGKPISTNADRTLKRGARRNLDRYQLRREALVEILIKNKFISSETPLTEVGKNTTHQTLYLRAASASQKVSLEDFSRILLAINKKRGYKSSRKTKVEADGVAIDGMAVAKILYNERLTPGQYVFNLLNENKKHIPDFYPSDLKAEFKAIWKVQNQFYPEILTDELFQNLQGKNKSQTWAICKEPFDIVGIKLKGNKAEQKLQKFEFRVQGVSEKLELEYFAIALQEINNTIYSTSGYLGKISDRSKVLYVDSMTVGEYMYQQIAANPHTSLKNQVFYRQDYLDEFEQIWETQAKFHDKLTPQLKEEIRDVIIFYQRPLKSQKGLLSFCLFESWQQTYFDEIKQKERKRTIGHRVIPKSSPLFQEFKIWQNINDLKLIPQKDINFDLFNTEEIGSYKKSKPVDLEEDDRILLFEEANLRGNLSSAAVLKLLGLSSKDWKLNFKEGINGNTTNQKLFDVYQEIAKREGYGIGWKKLSALEIFNELKVIFPEMGIDPEILEFDANLQGNEFAKQASYELWHLLYSAGDDGIISEEERLIYGSTDVNLKKSLHQKFGFKPEYATLLANITFSNDYGNLSARAIRKIIPYLQDGKDYFEACNAVGYNHANSLTKEQLDARVLKPKLELLEKNSLRNPVVEKILNQMVNLINQVIDEYGKPEEVRIELARDLKKTAKEREDASKYITSATKINLDIAKTIEKEFGFTPTKNDIVKYKLWEELAPRGHKSLFANRYIAKEDIFSKRIDIEHILPKALIFDDSFSNKTLCYREVNLKKANRTALDFITQDQSTELENYIERVEALYDKGKGTISKGKYYKLLKSAKDIKEGFIERDLRNSQYIAKKARNMLLEVFKIVTPTTGMITDKLREDWGVINVMKELNLPKYRTLGLIEIEERKNNKTIEKIKDWTKRNDHRHHAMDALVVAFTTHNHIQYINNLNARRDENHAMHASISGIENKITYSEKDKNGRSKRKYIDPLPEFRIEAKKHLKSILVSFKAKNKATTRNINKTKKKNGFNKKLELTPRGQLHKETIYGKSKRPKAKPTKINKNFSIESANMIVNPTVKMLVINHLAKFNNLSKLAFEGKTLKKHPLIWNKEPLKEVLCFEEVYTIRKDITSDLKLDKVVDEGIKNILIERKKAYGGKAKEAFSDLNKNPIWLNKEKGIQIKRVTITGVSNAEPLHYKKDHLGEIIKDENGKKIPTDFVSLGNNHHVAIYRDKNGKLQEKVVSLFEAVERKNQNLEVIDKGFNSHLGWEFLFTMKQNEMFVFPSEEFNPKEIDLMDVRNSKWISPNLFRVQTIAEKDYKFRHHLETLVTMNLDFTFKRLKSTGLLNDVVKVRLNHIGKIVQVGED
ncbi:type II CRISPR RNA-guided endonuclease Cas9 [Aequorivita marina]|uniref:type II CRISPR RNA-guided endonuclease Cas9 n=1 Tax=Aequorivita marina TaxID=3073654 RepID=UPI0028741299|nr:type II CRISPR RNA-guided endonuclease Cas9 [Aequorivita sp. S2608]MDS1299493.1 type II CRISPR RNA-guided endonuclease Cas9 [Aequorivita sp. S2608]